MVLAQVEPMAVAIFALFVAIVLGLSFYLGRRSKSAKGYFAAGGQIPWSVNGISFAGDYLSAASFLGICGLIAWKGYDGFLYSIGYLAGWIVALFVVAEPMKRLGKYTFTDALDSKFNSRGIQLAAAISTLVVSIFYLIPQMVGAGSLVTPLLGLDHHWGVIMVGAIVTVIVATAGMASTTWVQFLKGGLLIVFSLVLVIAVCYRGLSTTADQGGLIRPYEYRSIPVTVDNGKIVPGDDHMTFLSRHDIKNPKTGQIEMTVVKLAERLPLRRSEHGEWSFLLKGVQKTLDGQKSLLDALSKRQSDGKEVAGDLTFGRTGKELSVNVESWWRLETTDDGMVLRENQSLVTRPDKGIWVNGLPESDYNQLRQIGGLSKIDGSTEDTGPLGPFEYLSKLGQEDTTFLLPAEERFQDGSSSVQIFYLKPSPGTKVMRPGMKFKVEGTALQKLDFVSLMLALFFGTAALPHILIRYYTVPSPACARKSTIVAIAAIGFFYILTMYMGLGATVNSVLNPTSNNMSAPLLARSFNTYLFAAISAIAFATVLGTVSGLIVASSGAVAHDLMDRFFSLKMDDKQKVYAGKLAALTIGLIAIILGILFKGQNVAFLVGLAFAVAASANLPAILMLLFWKRTTAKGIMASIFVGIIAAVGLILLSPAMYAKYYGVTEAQAAKLAPIPLNNPGIISIPLSFLTLVVVSLLTKRKTVEPEPTAE